MSSVWKRRKPTGMEECQKKNLLQLDHGTEMGEKIQREEEEERFKYLSPGTERTIFPTYTAHSFRKPER